MGIVAMRQKIRKNLQSEGYGTNQANSNPLEIALKVFCTVYGHSGAGGYFFILIQLLH